MSIDSPSALSRGIDQRLAGNTLLVTLLGTAAICTVLVATTATVTLKGQRSSTDNRAAVEAQYAAESALARAASQLDRAGGHLKGLTLTSGTQLSTVLVQLGTLCGAPAALALPANLLTLPKAGQDLCIATKSAVADSAERFAFFANNTVRPSTFTEGQWKMYWKDLFMGGDAKLVKAAAGNAGASAAGALNTEVTGGLTLESVRVYPGGTMRIFFSTTRLNATSEVKSGTRVLAAREYTDGGISSHYIELSQPSFAQYQYFVNRRLSPTGSRLVFWDGDRFEGRVHANGTPGESAPLFYAQSQTGGPRFLGKYTSSPAFEWSDSSPNKAVSMDDMFKGGYAFNAQPVDLPTNANNQRLAAAGIEPGACVGGVTLTATTACLGAKLGASSVVQSGVYYTAAQNGTVNGGNRFAGGIYVKGDVSNLKLSKNGEYQVIEITQGTLTTQFRQTGPTTWEVRENGTLRKTMTNSPFNGMLFVDGKVGTPDPRGSAGLTGDGTDAPDIAAESQLTIAASSDVYIKDDATYSQGPQENPNAKNVLGIFSEGGNIKVNGQSGKDITVDATLMASARGKGFGTVDYDEGRGNPQPKIRITGGIIEEQSQGVGTTSRLEAKYETVRVCTRYDWRGQCTRSRDEQRFVGYEEVPGAGYSRNFKWDPRFDAGFAPPFFPTQGQFEARASFTKLSAPKGFRAVASE
ncbi:hypothetical protein [Deinococcus indicus]|uniref:hypothetical protein n=1 Tax=Deinococcus indicus TaxID=223556 RepID=UPI001178806E|nr:hypothetical protein [Deinococcus indicus]